MTVKDGANAIPSTTNDVSEISTLRVLAGINSIIMCNNRAG